MASLSRTIRHLRQCVGMLRTLLVDATHFLRLCLRPGAALAAENLFLRKQLALYQEHNVKPRRATHATRIALVWLSWWFDWRSALVVVQPETFSRWRRQRYHLCWPRQSQPGRLSIPAELQGLIRQMARDNLTWGQRRITNELRLKLGLRVSPCTVRKYVPTRLRPGAGPRPPSQRWCTFIRNHVRALIVSSVAADLIHGVQAVSVRIIRLVHRWWGRYIASGVQGSTPRNAVSLALLSNTRSTSAGWSLGTVEIISEDDRSPPDIKPPRPHDPCTTARVTPMDTLDVRPAVGAGYWWHRASPSARGADSLNQRESQAVPLRRAA